MAMNLHKFFTVWKSKNIEGWLMKGEPEVIYELANKYIKKGSTCAEVGSWKGKSTYIIGSVCKRNKAKLLSIDTFRGDTDPNSVANVKGGAYFEAQKDSQEFFKKNIEKNLKGLPVNYMIMTSHEASKKIPNHSLDFCFLDGDHTLPVILDDIKDFLPKIKKGGILLGHDYSMVENPRNGVRYSVNKVIGADKITVYHSIWTYRPSA